MWISSPAISSKTRDKLHLVLISMRPGQWPKNAFLFAALLFSHNLFRPAPALTSVLAFGIFCLASGVVYLFNDLLDMERDRNHPKKRSRPLASGALDAGTGALALAKRRHKLLALGEGAGKYRKALREYNLLFLDQMVSIATAGTIVSYSLYTLSEETLARFGTSQLWLTVPIVLYGISRYLYQAYRQGDGGQPEELVWKNKPLLICVAVYVVSVILIRYSPSGSLP